MGEIKAGVVVVTEFCRPHTSKYQGYIDYINRTEAVRNENTAKYNLYQDYMGNPKKTTSLFTAEKNELTLKEKNDLKEIFSEAQKNESIMWQTVISFDNRWLNQYGIINDDGTLIDEGKLKEVARGAVRRMLENEKLENAVWSGAIHFNTDNLHIHVATVEPIPMREKKEYVQYNYRYEKGKRIKEPILNDKGEPVVKMEYKGRFKQSSIEKCKSHVVKELVNDKENNIKINNIIRDSIVNQKKEHPISTDKEFINKFEELYKMMPDVSRNLWNYNNSIIAKLRDNIDEITTMYIEKYHTKEYEELLERIETQEQVYRTAYGDSGKDYKNNKLKDLYTRMGNAVLKEIRNYDKEVRKLEEETIKEVGEENIYENEKVEIDRIIEEANRTELNNTEDYLIEDDDNFIEPEVEMEDVYYKWSKNYKLAKRLIHDKNPNYEKAISLLITEHEKGNLLATYELGEVYRNGRGRKISQSTADKYYEKALKGFNYKLKGGEKTKQYLNYRIGKMHYYGLGTEQNYEKALECFTNAPDNVYAKYMLGKMLYYGQAVEKDYDAAYKIFVSISDENAYASYKAANMIAQGEVTEKYGFTQNELYDQAFVGFMTMEQKMEDDNLEYRIGMMYIKGQGVDEDKKTGIEFLEKSAEAKNVYAMNKLAQIYIEENYQDKIPGAIEYLKDVAEKANNSIAMYTLGNVYASEKYGMQDLDEAFKWYQMAENNGNGFASYKLGKLYMNDNQIDKAIEHFEKSDNKYSWYNLGKIYMDESYEQHDFVKGIKYLEKSAEDGNVFAQYYIGREYYRGEKIEINMEKAERFLNMASEQDNEFASYILGKINYERKAYEKAEKEFMKCSNEYLKPYSEYYLGKMYLDKDGSVFNAQKGIAYLEQSFKDGNSSAAVTLGITYLAGDVVNQNRTLGMEWINNAAEQGNEFAQNFLKNQHVFKEHGSSIGLTSAMLLSNAAQFLKKSMKNEWQRRQNVREHEMLMQRGEEKE